MTDDELKQQLVDITTELYHAGVVTATGGNISVRSATREDAAWITPSQIFKGGLTPDDMVLIDLDGKKIDGPYKPSVECVYHGGILKNRSDVNAVVHSHAPLSTIFGMTGMKMIPITTEAIFLANFPVIPWYLGGTKELAKAVLEQIGNTKVQGAFLCNHGLITLGKDLRKAADGTLTVEHVIHMLLTLKMAGLEPELIPEKTVQFLAQFAGAF
jgi:L-ribulose-5-phosphate 4-epimerase